MPTYEYACTDCKNQWEEIQKISEPALEVCPKCGHRTAKRQISGGNFILKGGGWYADLYSSAPKKGGEAKTEGRSESKPEGKSEAAGGSSPSPSSPTSSASSSSGSSGSTSK